MNPYGAILPNHQPDPLQTYLQLKQQQEQESRYRDQLALQQQRYADNLLSDLAERLDLKHSFTGTAFDPIFQENANTVLQQVAGTIKKGGSYADALMQAMNGANEIKMYADKVKSVRSSIEEGAKVYQKDPSIDWQRLAREGIARAFLKLDENGQVGLRDPKEVDDSIDYVSDVLEKMPEKVVIGSKSLDELMRGADKKTYENKLRRDVGGVERVRHYRGEYFPYNTLYNEKGEAVSDPYAGGAVKVGVRGEKIKLPGGQEIDLATREDLEFFSSKPGAKAWLNAQAKELEAMGMDKEIARRYVLHNYLTKNNQGFINKVDDEYDDSQLQGQLFRREMRHLSEAIRNTGKGENFIQSLYKIKNNDPNYLGLKYEEDDAPSKEFYDVSKFLPNGRLYGMNKPNKDGIGIEKEEYNRVGYDKKTGLFYVKKTSGSDWEPISNSAKWIREIAELNNVPLSQAIKQTKEDPNEEAMAELQKAMSKKKSKNLLDLLLPDFLKKNK